MLCRDINCTNKVPIDADGLLFSSRSRHLFWFVNINSFYKTSMISAVSSVISVEAKEIRKLNQMLKEKDKEIEFLKKAAAFFAKEID